MVRGRKLNSISGIDKAIASRLDGLRNRHGDRGWFPLLLGEQAGGLAIDARLVDRTFDQLQESFAVGCPCGKLVVVLESGGGDIDAAYNLAQLFRSYGSTELEFIVPRWAKSAATLLACSGDVISMTPVAELGPLDPQITQMNAIEQRLEQFSPLHIESTLELIRNEFKNGNKELAEGLMQRLQFPLTLGSFKKSLELAQQYLEKLLTSRMLKANPGKAKEVATRLTEGYADHGFCINLHEAEAIGLKVKEVPPDLLTTIWQLHKLSIQRQELELERRRKEIASKLKDLPPELLEQLPPGLLGKPTTSASKTFGGWNV